ncbi:MAG: YDG domain-containing protein [Caulobacterales bacterium]
MLLGTAALLGALGAGSSAAAGPVLPTGGAVAAGAANIGTPTGFKLTIDQSSAKAVINWSSFSIGQGGQVQFNNGSGVTLNRVTGGGSLSQIDGGLAATGGLYLLNPNGVIVGKSGVINVGGSFVASTLDVKNDQFMNGGDLTFSGASLAGVVNDGLIVSAKGEIALIGAQVTNDGTLQAPGGDVALGAGHAVVLHDQTLDDRKLTVTVGGADTAATNSGLIAAASAELIANGGNVYALAVNSGAAIRATGVSTKDGDVYLIAGGGNVTAKGEIDAHHADGTGGLVETSGETVDFTGLSVKAGTWLIDPVNLTVDAAAASTIDANLATTNVTLKTGASSASGPGNQSAGPGDININAPIDWSSNNVFLVDAYHSININAPITVHGPGSLQLVTNDGGTGGDYFIASSANISFQGTPHSGESLFINGNFYSLIYSAADLPTGDNFVCCNYAVGNSFSFAGQLYTHAVIGGYFGSQFFFGTFAGLGNTISDININQSVSDTQFSANGDLAKGYVGFFGQIGFDGFVRDLHLANVNVTGADGMVVGGLAGFSQGQISNVTVSGSVTGGDRVDDIFGTSLVNAGGLVGINSGGIANSSSSATVSAGIATAGGLVGKTEASSVITNSQASGAVSVGDDLTGAGDVMAGGLIGDAAGSGFGQITLSGDQASGAVSGGQQAFLGGFAGSMTQTLVSVSAASGAVTGGAGSYVGGFVGSVDNSTLTTSYASGAVSQTAGGIASVAADRIGGFAGYIGQNGVVTLSYADGALTTKTGPDAADATLAGGFVGDLDHGSVADSYATGSVTVTGSGTNLTGGFVGLVEESGSVQRVYASGAVAATPGSVGGLAGRVGNAGVGDTSGSISNSYWDKGTTGEATGYNLAGTGTATNVTAIGGGGPSPYAAATYGAFDLVGAWTMIAGETRPMLVSEYSTTIVNAHQLQLISLHPTANYVIAADINASETSNAAGVWDTANGFVPIGGTVASEFTGSLDGGFHTISNLHIVDTTVASQTLDGYSHNGFVGLFGIIGAAGSVQNLTLANAVVTGGDGMLVGALAGAVEGTVKNAASSGVVTVGNDLGASDTASGYAAGGGLVGDAAFAGSISGSSSSAVVNGGKAAAGGLVGTLRSGATLSGDAASGAVTVASGVSGGAQADAGGLVGLINGFQSGGINPLTVNVSNSHASGAVSGGGFSAVGGFVGTTNHGAITTSFATGAVAGQGDTFVGGFAGLALNTTIGASYATGGVSAIAAAAAGGNDIAGGFLGEGGAGDTITGSWASGAVSANGAGTQPATAGGFVGVLNSGGSITGAYALGATSILNAQAGDDAGGFGGSVSGTLNNFYATGAVSDAAGTEGGLVGVLGATGNATTAYWDEGTTLRTTAIGQTILGGTATNLVGVGGSTGLNPFNASSYANFNLATTWFMIDGETRPILRAEYSTTITDAHQLELMALNRSAAYTVANAFNASETTSLTGVWNPANGFVPVGASAAQPFTGTFNGNGFAISNLTIIDTTAVAQTLASGFATNGAVGLFGFASAASVLQNVSLASAHVTAGSGMVAGALVGSTAGLVTNSTSSGTVTVGDTLNGPINAAAGGLVGDLGDGVSAGVIEFSSSSATVAAGDGIAGGLVGWAHGGAQILLSSASGAVTVGNDPSGTPAIPAAGGLIGQAQGTSGDDVVVTGSFAGGAVHGGSGAEIGGFGGRFDWVNVSFSYATGAVTQTAAGVSGNVNEAGGFVGFMGNGVIQNAFASGDVITVGAIGFPSEAGGFVGRLSAGEIQDSYASGTVGGDVHNNLLGGFAGTVQSGGGLDRILATGAVSGTGTLGGLVGSFIGDHLIGGYWDAGTTGQDGATGNGASGIDATDVSGDPFNPASYPELDFVGTWSTPSSGFYPQLYGVSHVLKLTPQDLEYTYGDFPIFAFNVLGLQGGDARSAVTGATVRITGDTLSNAGFFAAGTASSTLSAASAVGSTGVYRIIYNTGNVLIDQRPINPALTGTVQKTYDSTNIATIDPVNNAPNIVDGNSNVGVVPGDLVAIDPGSIQTAGTYDTANVDLSQCNATCIGVNTSGYTASGADIANYTFTGVAHDFIGEIDPATLTLTAITDTKIYDGGVTSTGTPGVSGLFGLDNVTNLAQQFDSKNVGPRTLNVSDFTVNDGNNGANYAVSLVSASGGSITPASLSIDAQGDTKVYDGTTTSAVLPQVSGLVGGDTASNLSQVFDLKDAGSRSLSVSTFTINDGNGGNNYTISTFGNDGEITPKPISASLVGTVEKTYDGNTSAPVTVGELTLPGAIAGDDVTLNVSVPGTYATRNAGSGINVTVSGLSISGGDATNYTFTDGASGDVGLIDPAALTISAVTQTRVYDGNALSTGVPQVVGLVGGDSASNLSQVFDSKNAGGRTLSVNGYSISDGNSGLNYTVSLASAAGMITPAPLSIDAVGDTKVYDGTTTSAVVPQVFGLVGGDTASNLSQMFDSKNAGGRTLSVNGFSISDGNGGANYDVSTFSSEGTIDQRPLSATITGTVEKTYDSLTDATVTSGEITLVNAIAGDSLSVGVPFTGNYATPNAGSGIHVSVFGLTLGGGDAGNYTFTGTAAGNVGIIDPALLTITAAADSKVYDGTVTSGGTPIVSGLFDDDSVSGLSQAFNSKNAGNRTLNVVNDFTVSDGNNGNNYTVQLVSAAGMITPAPLSIDAVGDTKVYDGTVTSGGVPQVFGLVGGDTASNLGQVFDLKNAGSRSLNVSTYTINDGNGGHNYDITTAGNDGEITPKPITAALVGTVEKTYDSTTSAPVTSGELTLPGAIAGDNVTVDVSGPGTYATANAGSHILVTVSGLSINGSDATNYTFTDGASGNVGLIDPATLTIKAVTDSKVYNGTVVSAGVPTVSGLFGEDGVTGLSQVFDSKNAGARTLNVVNGFSVNDGNNGGNYTVHLVSAAGTITKAPLSIDAVTDTKVYNGTTTSAGVPLVSGLVEGDSASNLSQAFASKNAGARTLSVNGFSINDGNGGGNYAITFNTADGSITQASLTISAVADTKVYNGAVDSAGQPIVIGLVEGDSVSNLSQVFDSKNAGARTLAVTGFTINDGNDGANYTVHLNGADGTITPAQLTLTAVADTKVYDGGTGSSGTPLVSGLVEGDGVSNLAQSFNSRNAGARTITVDGGYTISDGNDGGNYTVMLVSASGAITPAPLTLSAVTLSRTYDGTTSSSVSPTEQGLVEGDSLSGLTQSFDSRNAGERTLTVNNGYLVNDGNEGGNYTVTLVSASGTITPATLTLAAVSDTKTYDGNTVSGGAPTTGGLVEGDSVSGLSQSFDAKNAGERTLAVNNGFAVNDGNDGANYTIKLVSAAGTITPKLLTVTLTGEVLKPYDGNSTATLANDNYQLSGVLTGDVVTLNDPRLGLYDTPFVGRGKTVTVSGLALSGAAAQNYQVASSDSGDVGVITIVLPIQPQIVTDPPQIPETLTGQPPQSLVFTGLGGSPFAVFLDFPVANDDSDKGPGDNLPITGAGNGDLWEGSDLDKKANP